MERPTGYEPHYVLKPIAPDVWIADGEWIRFYGLPFPTRMTVVRLADGGIWVHSPIGIKDDLGDAVERLGPVRHLVAPNWIHYAWLPDWQTLFPKASTWGSPGVVRRAESRGIRLQLDHALSDEVPDAWKGQIDQFVADSGFHREVVFFHTASRTLILTDLIENFELAHMPFWSWPLLKIGGVCDPDGGMPRDIAVSFKLKAGHLRKIVDTMIAWNPERVIFAHGRWYDKNGAEEIKRAFRVAK